MEKHLEEFNTLFRNGEKVDILISMHTEKRSLYYTGKEIANYRIINGFKNPTSSNTLNNILLSRKIMAYRAIFSS